MNPYPDALAVATKKPAGLSRKLLPVLAGLALLAAGANLYRWFDKPALEPLPIAATEKMSPPIRELIQAALRLIELTLGPMIAPIPSRGSEITIPRARRRHGRTMLYSFRSRRYTISMVHAPDASNASPVPCITDCADSTYTPTSATTAPQT